jgi:hypothetical protein
MKPKKLSSRLFLVTLCVIALNSLQAQQNTQVFNGERFIAYSLYNFSKLIDWPNSGTLTNFQIAVVGDKKVYTELVELAKNKKVGNAVYQIDFYKTVEEMNGSHQIVYLSNLQSGNVKSLAQNPNMKNVLLVTEREGMTNAGSTISFLVNNEGQMGFEIAKSNALKNQLTIRSQLERMAMRVS